MKGEESESKSLSLTKPGKTFPLLQTTYGSLNLVQDFT